jgi:hypothetical protein
MQAQPDIQHVSHPSRTRITLRAFALSALFIVLSCLWVKWAEIIIFTTMVSESAPPIPALATVIFLVALNPILKRLGNRWQLTRGEILAIYAAVCIGATVPGHGVVKSLFPALAVPFYFATPENKFAELQKHVPSWFAPRDPEVLRQMYEGAPDGKVPWGAWALPLSLWTLFFVVLFGTLFCFVVILRKQWTDNERLTFPLLYLPLDLTEEKPKRDLPPFFRDPLMWTGVSISVLYNVLNILNAYNPSVPALGYGYDIGSLFTEKPLSAARPMNFYYRPDLTGLGYLVPLDISFTIWVSYVFMRLQAVTFNVLGYEVAGLPFDQEQGAGAYGAIALLLLWLARRHLKEVIVPTFQRSNVPTLECRFAVFGAMLGTIFLLGWCYLAGMMLWTAAIYFLLIFAFALVYARIRAETGAPMIWLFPFYQQKRMMLYTLGSAPFAPGGDFATLTIFSSLYWLSRGYFPSMIGYHIDNLKLADEANLSRRGMVALMFFALVVGLVGSYWIFLTTYYTYGANVLEGGTTQGGLRTAVAMSEYNELIGFMKAPKLTDWWRTGFLASGFCIALGLGTLRTMLLRFPLHPLGYAMATAYGTRIWGPFFLVWLFKSLILRTGGAKLYRRYVPMFVGLALGHYFTTGIVWGFVGLFFQDTARRYSVGFG